MDSISTSYLNSLTNIADTQNTKNSADSITSSAKKLSSSSSKEDLTDAVKSFESYFLEQVIKKEKENLELLKGDDDSEDLATSQLKDYYLDQTISKVSSEMVDKNFGTLTDSFVQSLSRTYHISDSTKTDSKEASTSDSSEKVSGASESEEA